MIIKRAKVNRRVCTGAASCALLENELSYTINTRLHEVYLKLHSKAHGTSDLIYYKTHSPLFIDLLKCGHFPNHWFASLRWWNQSRALLPLINSAAASCFYIHRVPLRLMVISLINQFVTERENNLQSTWKKANRPVNYSPGASDLGGGRSLRVATIVSTLFHCLLRFRSGQRRTCKWELNFVFLLVRREEGSVKNIVVLAWDRWERIFVFPWLLNDGWPLKDRMG